MKPVSCQYCWRAARLAVMGFEGMVCVCGVSIVKFLRVRWICADSTLRCFGGSRGNVLWSIVDVSIVW